MGTAPAKIWKPLPTAVFMGVFCRVDWKVGFGVKLKLTPAHPGCTSAVNAPPETAKRMCWRIALLAVSSCNPVEKMLQELIGLLNGPLAVAPLTPSGKNGRAA